MAEPIPRLPTLPHTPAVAAITRINATSGVGTSGIPDNILDTLTDADRELIYNVTGQLVEPGFETSKDPASAFALEIAHQRTTGLLGPGHEVSASMLKDLSRQYDDAHLTAIGQPAHNPIAPFLSASLAFLISREGTGHVDVTA